MLDLLNKGTQGLDQRNPRRDECGQLSCGNGSLGGGDTRGQFEVEALSARRIPVGSGLSVGFREVGQDDAVGPYAGPSGSNVFGAYGSFDGFSGVGNAFVSINRHVMLSVELCDLAG